MAFLLRALSGGERFKERAQDVEQLRKEFNLKKDEVSRAVLHNEKVHSLVEMIFDGCYPEAQHYLKSPSQQWLKANKEAIWRILSGLSSQDVPFISRLTDGIQKHGVEPLCDIVLELLKLISQLLINKDIKGGLLESIDYGWHIGSPLSGRPRIFSTKNSHQQIAFSKDVQTRRPVEIVSSSRKGDGTKDVVRYMDEGSSNFVEAPKDDKFHHASEGESFLSLDEREISSSKKSDESTVDEQEKYEDVSGPNRTPLDSRPGKELDMKVEMKNAHAYPQTEGNQVIGKLGGTSDHGLEVPEAAITRSASGQFYASTQTPADSSLIDSRRMSYTGSEPSYSQYTTDSDDDSLSTSSHVSLLVAVSEAQESDSTSVDDFDLKSAESETNGQNDMTCNSTETCSDPTASDFIASAENTAGVGSDKREHATAVPLHTASSEDSDVVITGLHYVGDELAQDKLPISSSVVLSGRNAGSDNGLSETSFYTPEMWTYSEKDASAFEGVFNDNEDMKTEGERPSEHFEAPDGNLEQEKEMLEEEKVMVATSVEDKYVSVQPVLPMKLSDTSDHPLKRGKIQVDEKWDHSDSATQKASVKGLEDNTDVNNVIASETDGMDKELAAAVKADDRKCMPAEGALQVGPEKEDSIVESSNKEGKNEDVAVESSSREGKDEDLAVESSSKEGKDEDLAVESSSKEGKDEDLAESSSICVEEKMPVEKSCVAEDEGVSCSVSSKGEEVSAGAVCPKLDLLTDVENSVAHSSGRSSGDGEDLTVGKSSKDGKHGDLAVGSLSIQEDEEQVLTVNASSAADEKLDLVTDVENSITEKSEAAKAPETVHYFGRSGEGSEPLAIPHSGLIPLSGPIYSSHSGPIPYSGSLSLRSDSSTNSTRSFAFPILSATDWNSSPVKMAPPDRRYFRRRHGWRGFCCFCCTKSSAYH